MTPSRDPKASPPASPAHDSDETATAVNTVAVAVIDQLPSPVALLDRNLTFVCSSRRYRECFAPGAGDVSGRPLDAVFPDMPQDWMASFLRVIAGEAEAYRQDITIRRRGMTCHYRHHLQPWRDASGAVIGLMISAEDITTHKLTENALRDSDRQFHEIFRNVPVGLFRSTPEGKFLTVNPALADMLGYASPEALMAEVNRTNIADRLFIDPAARDPIVGESLATTQWVHREMAYYRRDYSILYANLLMHTVRNDAGGLLFLEGMVEDISLRKQTQRRLKKSEARYRALVEMSTDWIWEVDAEARYTYASPVVEQLLGYRPEEVLGKTPFDFMAPDEASRIGQLFTTIAAARKPFQRIYNINRHRDGHEVIMETSGVPIFDDDGVLKGYRGIDRDATERYRAEIQLKDYGDRLQQYLDVAGVIFVVLDAQGLVQLINRRGCEVLGYDEADILGRDWFSAFLPKQISGDVKAVFLRLMAGEIEPVEYVESLVCCADGTERRIAWHNTVIRDAWGRITATLSSGEDITERDQAERHLKESEAKYRALVNNLHEGVVVIQADRVAYVNDQLARMLGTTTDTLMDLAITEIRDMIAPEDRDIVMGYYRRRMAGETVPEEYTTRLMRVDTAERITVRIHAANMTYNNRAAVFVTLQDITEQHAAQRALDYERQRLFALLETLPAWVALIDADRQVRYANSQFAGRFGDNPHALCRKTVPCEGEPAADCPVRAVMVDGKSVEWEKETADGLFYQVYAYPFTDVDGKPMALELGLDITHRRNLEREAINTSRLASLGELAAGVAHEINNPVNGVINYAQLLLDTVDADAEAIDLGRRIIKEGERIAAIVSNLLTFARQKADTIVPVRLEDVVTDALQLLGAGLRQDGIRVTVSVPADLPLISGSPQKLQQVVINLLSNARYALNQRFPGASPYKRLTVSAGMAEKPDGGAVRMTVRDEGAGIPSQIIEKICDPFYTTKPAGEGTGLGLSISYGIVHEHGGTLTFSSRENTYTEAIVDLPASKPPQP